MTNEEILQQLRPWREKWKRTAWRPVTADGESEITASKFAGTPWLQQGEPWPTCQTCNAAMPLLLQLNLDALPAPLADTFGSGLLQLFYCMSCDDAWDPFSRTSLARVVEPSGIGGEATPPDDAFPAKTITAWEPFDDLPHIEEHSSLGLTCRFEFDAPARTRVVRTTVMAPEFGVDAAVNGGWDIWEEIGYAAEKDKLAGWPQWIQGPEYPACPRCGEQMRYLFQIDSEDHLPVMFGDVGTGHITQCPEHKDVVAFGWACS